MNRQLICLVLTAVLALAMSSVDVKIEANPDTIEEGLTKEITITCTAKISINTSDPDSMSSLNSLVLSFNNGNQTQNTSLISLYNNKVNKLPDFQKFHGTASDGQQDALGESKLSMTISNIDDSHVGTYTCKAIGFSDLFLLKTVEVSVTITSSKPDNNSTIGHVADIETQLKNLTSTLVDSTHRWMHVDKNPIFIEFKVAKPTPPSAKTTTATTTAQPVTTTSSSNTTSSASTNPPTTTTMTTTTTTTTIPTTTPVPSNITSSYLLSKATMGNAYMCQFVCFVQGGYLAEINDQEEFEFINDFLTDNLTASDVNVWLGTTEVGHLSVWKHMFNVNDTVNLVWGNFQSDGQNCAAMTSRTGFKMDDLDCEAEVGRALCEIPQKKR